jgi:hypothetical protein
LGGRWMKKDIEQIAEALIQKDLLLENINKKIDDSNSGKCAVCCNENINIRNIGEVR